MKKYIYITSILFFVILSFSSCDRDDLVFNEKNGVYFATEKGVDSIYYSFLGRTSIKDTLSIPIEVMGVASQKERKYKVEIDHEFTTAEEGLHYEKLNESYSFRADNFSDYFQLIISQEDPDLEIEDKVIALKMVESDDFDPGYKDKIHIKIYITNKLIKPSYWDNFLFIYFGEYSKVKHELAINQMGDDFPYLFSEALSSEYGPAHWMVHGRSLATYIIENEVIDENGNKIYPWQVF